jgi:hypothetical protein
MRKPSLLVLLLLTFTLVSLFSGNDRATSIESWAYQKLLGRGMDVDWCKTETGMEQYKSSVPRDFKAMGISHVRIRIKDDADEKLLSLLDRVVGDCLKSNLIPVIAYQADDFKKDPSEKNAERVIAWWETVARRYKNESSLLSFDMIIEVTDELNREPDTLNALYRRLVPAIRKTNPKRILMISPRLRSDPTYLCELEIPDGEGRYLMAEWHFYAAGPSKTNEKKLWTTGTKEEKKLIQDKISLALEWQEKHHIPTWVGAWMPGNYNDGDDYSLQEQIVFSTFMKDSLTEAGIPFSINSDNQFYDREHGGWIKETAPLLLAIYGR